MSEDQETQRIEEIVEIIERYHPSSEAWEKLGAFTSAAAKRHQCGYMRIDCFECTDVSDWTSDPRAAKMLVLDVNLRPDPKQGPDIVERCAFSIDDLNRIVGFYTDSGGARIEGQAYLH